MKRIATNGLILLFLTVYLLIIHFFVWVHLPIYSSTGVFLGSVLALLISLALAIVTVSKIVDILQS